MTPRDAGQYRLAEMRAGLDRGWLYLPCQGKQAMARPGEPLDQAAVLDHATKRNIAIALGGAPDASGLCAIDAPSTLGLPPTWTIETAHGVLVLFRPPRPCPPSRTRASIRFLGADAWAMAPGSVHPETGHVYRWREGCSPADLELAELPGAILEALNAPEPAPVEPEPEPVGPELPPIAIDPDKDYPADADIEVTVSGDDRPLAFTDKANGELFVRLYRDRVRYSPGIGWLEWDGTRWRPDEDGAAQRYAKRVADHRMMEALAAGDPDTRKKAKGDAVKCEAAKRILATLTMAQTETPLIVPQRNLDHDHFLLNTSSGTVDLRTGALRDHDQADLITKRTGAAYDPDAECPRFEEFILEVLGGDRDLRWYVQKSLGYACTGDTREQCFWLAHGSGRNGKSTLFEAVREVLGDYARTAPAETFMPRQARDSTNDIASLRGQRFVITNEAGEGRKFDEEVLKRMTGGDTVSARFMYREWFEFRPVMKLFIAANHRPEIRGQDDGIWRRVRLIPFEVSFRGREDRTLPTALRAEASGILRWLVQGAIGWFNEGLGTNQRVTEATDGYREESDELGEFVAECCVTGHPDHYYAPSAGLYAAYAHWAKARGVQKPMTQTMLGRRLRDRGFKTDRSPSGTVRIWKGISVSPEVSEEMSRRTGARLWDQP